MAHPVLLRTKVEVAAACGLNAPSISKIFGISKQTVYRWLISAKKRKDAQKYKEWRINNKEIAVASHRKWYYANLEKSRKIGRESMKEWRKKHPEKAALVDSRKRKRIRKWKLSKIERLMCETYYLQARRLTKETGIKHEVDHIWPLSRGGPHLPWNLCVMTAEENRRKSNNI